MWLFWENKRIQRRNLPRPIPRLEGTGNAQAEVVHATCRGILESKWRPPARVSVGEDGCLMHSDQGGGREMRGGGIAGGTTTPLDGTFRWGSGADLYVLT